MYLVLNTVSLMYLRLQVISIYMEFQMVSMHGSMYICMYVTIYMYALSHAYSNSALKCPCTVLLVIRPCRVFKHALIWLNLVGFKIAYIMKTVKSRHKIYNHPKGSAVMHYRRQGLWWLVKWPKMNEHYRKLMYLLQKLVDSAQ